MCSARRWRENSGSGMTLAPGGQWLLPGGLGQFRLATCGPSQVEMVLFLLLGVLLLTNDVASLGSGDVVPWVGRFMDGVDMWGYEQGGSYPVTLTWGYERGRFVCFVLTLRDATCGEVRGLVDHMCWTTGGQVRRAGLRAGRFVGQDHERAGSCEHHVPETKANQLYDLKTDKSWG